MNTHTTIATQTYWWVNNIIEFERLEIQPSTVIDYDSEGRELVAACSPDEAIFWIVYGHYQPWTTEGDLHALEKFSTEDEAQKFYNLLIQLYPHLCDEPVRPKFVPRKPTLH